MECIISTMEDTYILSLDHSLISGLITSSMFTPNTEKEDRKEKKKPWSCLSFFCHDGCMKTELCFCGSFLRPSISSKATFPWGKGRVCSKRDDGGQKREPRQKMKKMVLPWLPGDYLLISEHLKRNSVGKRSKASIILNKRTRLIDFSHLYNFWKLDLS